MSNNNSGFMDIFIQRPVLSVVISLSIILMGAIGIFKLPVLQYPQLESATLIIDTNFTGASAKEVQGFVTEPIERAASSVPGVDYISSESTAGTSQVKLWLNLNQNSTDALAELSTRLGQIRFELPEQAEDPAITVQRADRPYATFYLDVDAQEMSKAEITDFLTRRINPVLAAINGVQRVGLEGSRAPSMRIWLAPSQLTALKLSAADIEQALQANNIPATLGKTKNQQQRIDLIADTLMQSVTDFQQLVVKEIDGSIIRLQDVARIELGAAEGEINARLNHRDSIYISVWPLPGSNEIAIADQLYEVLDQINPTLPSQMHIGIAYDATQYMRLAIEEIFTTLGETILLVGIVILILMGSFRTAIVPLITIPISILGAIGMMSLMGFSLNLLTILAIVLSVGLVVDDAIVVVENVGRHMRSGIPPIQAALKSSRQLFAPIIGMTLTLAAVYAPIGFMSGLTGLLFKEFVFTLAIAVLISGLVALTLSPIMSAYVSPHGGKEGRATRWINHRFSTLERLYAGILKHSIQWRYQIIFFAIFISLLVLPFYYFSQKELAPTEDQSSITIIVESPPDASLAYSTTQMQDIVGELLQLEGAREMWQIVNPAGGFGGVEFVDSKQRSESVQELLPQAYGLLAGIPGVRAFPVLPAALPSAGNFDVELMLISTDQPQQMQVYAEKIVAAAFASGHFLFADSDLKIDLPQVQLRLDRERLADLGLQLEQVNQQLSTLLSSAYVNRFNLEGRAYKVIPMLNHQNMNTPEALMELNLISPSGELIPLSSVARLEHQVGPRKLTRFNRLNSFKIYGGIVPGSTKEQALSALEQAAQEIVPRHYQIDYAGESRQIRSEGNNLVQVLGIALIVVYLVLAVQFNSFRDPLVVLLGSVPLALSGAMLFPYFGWTSINIYSQIGLITLVGLIAKNGILIVEFANHLQQGQDKLHSIINAASTRLRPILMTTAATVLGHFPLLLVTGAGAEARNSIGIILVAGMMLGTLFTLFILPSVYLLVARDQHKNSPEELNTLATPQTV